MGINIVCANALTKRYALFFAANLDMPGPSPTFAEEEETDRESNED